MCDFEVLSLLLFVCINIYLEVGIGNNFVFRQKLLFRFSLFEMEGWSWNMKPFQSFH